ncbi:MAG: hypothetical protein EZS28_048300 [Streblomastix strix]|uniref:Uncharacterized protein n=1 Tax=Streblomastix strix TaxID=222440 RepID=A0A5J4TCQ6_9EUKA|nr:MAG: hypothetical protein EZS28_048300 [Streblomastix strix]
MVKSKRLTVKEKNVLREQLTGPITEYYNHYLSVKEPDNEEGFDFEEDENVADDEITRFMEMLNKIIPLKKTSQSRKFFLFYELVNPRVMI